jgi:hypothetical protein
MAGVYLNPTSLKRVGVSVSHIGPGKCRLTCDACGITWTPILLRGGRLPHGWWKCPRDPSHTQKRV